MPAHYRIRNWSDYNRALIKRGNLNIWIDDGIAQDWYYTGPNQRGAQPTYSDLAIETALRLKTLFHLGLRQCQGFLASIFRMLDLPLLVPNYSTLCRRQADLAVVRSKQAKDDGPRHIVIDSTGLKVYGEGEWKRRQHGKSKRRTWRKLHLAIDPETGEITAETLTENNKDDASQVEALLAQIDGIITHVGGDGGYDKWKSYEAIAAVDALPIIPPQRNAKIKQHGNSKAPPLPRDEALRFIRRHGRRKWKRVHGYHRRSLAETAIGRYKRIVGRVLSARTLVRQQVEARIGVEVLNRMSALGMPESYPVLAK